MRLFEARQSDIIYAMRVPEQKPHDVTASTPTAFPSTLIIGTGEMADHIRHYPWHETPLGPLDLWPSALLDNVNLILNSAAALAIYWGAEMIFLCNDASNRMIGRRENEPLGCPALRVWGDKWQQVEARFTAVLSSGASFYNEDFPIKIINEASSSEVFLDYSLSPIYHKGEIVGIFRALQETTESVLAMRALAEANERLEMALSAGNGLGIWDWHMQSGLVYGDQAMADLYRIDPKLLATGVSAKLFERMLHPDDIVVLTDAVMECILTGKNYCVDYRVRRADDTYRWVQSIGRCLYDSEGHAYRVTGFKTEIAGPRSSQQETATPSLFTSAQLILLPVRIRSFLTGTVFLLAEEPRKVSLEVIPGPTSTQLTLWIPASDLGKVIGKDGRTIRSIRTLLLAINGGSDHRYSIDVVGEKADASLVN